MGFVIYKENTDVTKTNIKFLNYMCISDFNVFQRIIPKRTFNLRNILAEQKKNAHIRVSKNKTTIFKYSFPFTYSYTTQWRGVDEMQMLHYVHIYNIRNKATKEGYLQRTAQWPPARIHWTLICMHLLRYIPRAATSNSLACHIAIFFTEFATHTSIRTYDT